MSKFNQTNTIKTTNKCGHAAYKLGNKTDLATKVLTCLVNEPKFYGDTTPDLVALAEKSDMMFVSQLAIYARNVMNLRSVSHVLTAIVARYGKGELTRRTVHGVVRRADDITEILSYYLHRYGKPIPNALKRQIAIEIQKFDEYQIAKYNGGKKELTFKDVLRICHPKPVTSEKNKLFNEIINDTLPIPYTWEVELSKNGNNAETWEKLIASGKVGYMALLRNIRNIVNARPCNLDVVLNRIADKNEVRNSKQLPFRFYSAYRENKGCSSKILDALEDAASASCENIQALKGKTLIALDTSGSMGWEISNRSKIRSCDVAAMLGAIANRICEDAQVVTFDTALKNMSASKRNGILATADSLAFHGGGTNLKLPFDYILKSNETFDRVIVISDNEINSSWGGYNTCQGLVDKYRSYRNPNLWVHAIDTAGYGTTQFVGKNTNIMAGWSDRVFEYISEIESGLTTFIKKIEDYEVHRN